MAFQLLVQDQKITGWHKEIYIQLMCSAASIRGLETERKKCRERERERERDVQSKLDKGISLVSSKSILISSIILMASGFV